MEQIKLRQPPWIVLELLIAGMKVWNIHILSVSLVRRDLDRSNQ